MFAADLAKVGRDLRFPLARELVEEREVGVQVVAFRGEIELAQAVEVLLRAFVHLERQDQGWGHVGVGNAVLLTPCLLASGRSLRWRR
jgi:hypothetical protein